jgi:hypothetical protein
MTADLILKALTIITMDASAACAEAVAIDTKDRTVNGTFASGAPARNSQPVDFCSLLSASGGLTRLVNGRRR